MENSKEALPGLGRRRGRRPGDQQPDGCVCFLGMGRRCDACGGAAIPLHVVACQHGQFCEKCCPVCNAEKSSGGGRELAKTRNVVQPEELK
jgi:hypothetical protein